MKNGFTVVELLAVIVILAIISMITIPATKKIITDYKIKSAKTSAENYIIAIDTNLHSLDMNINNNLDGLYTITENGKILVKDEDNVIVLEYNGTAIHTGKILIENNEVKQLIDAKISNWNVEYVNGKIKLS